MEACPVKRLTDEEIIAGLRKRDNRVLQYIYKNSFNAVKQLVIHNAGSDSAAEDIFQETLIIIFKKLRDNDDFQLTANFSVIYTISRRLGIEECLPREIRGVDFTRHLRVVLGEDKLSDVVQKPCHKSLFSGRHPKKPRYLLAGDSNGDRVFPTKADEASKEPFRDKDRIARQHLVIAFYDLFLSGIFAFAAGHQPTVLFRPVGVAAGQRDRVQYGQPVLVGIAARPFDFTQDEKRTVRENLNAHDGLLQVTLAARITRTITVFVVTAPSCCNIHHASGIDADSRRCRTIVAGEAEFDIVRFRYGAATFRASGVRITARV